MCVSNRDQLFFYLLAYFLFIYYSVESKSYTGTRTDPASTLLPNLAKYTCCRFLSSSNAEKIIECVNATNIDSFDRFANLQLSLPSLTVAVVTRATSEVFEYAAYALLVQSIYAKENGYLMLPLYSDSTRCDYKYHRKLVPIIEAIVGRLPFVDYIAWMDADLIPLDMNLRIESFASAYPLAHIIMSKDVSTLVNTGFIIVRGGSKWAITFLQEWLAQKDLPGVANEQLGFDNVYYQRGFKETSVKIAILEAHELNSIASPMGQQLPHHKVCALLLHIPELQ
jgi:hypothetical protein